MFNVALLQRLLTLGCLVAAVWLTFRLAQGDYLLPAAAALVALGATLVRVFRAPLTTIALATAVFGYIVGNRGFAQFMPVPALPLLPAEIVLLVAGGWLVLQCALTRELPFRKDGLNWMVLAWLALGTARIAFDVRTYGLMAVRDYAMIYYSLFFFLAQHLARDRRARQFLVVALTAACFAQPLAAVLSDSFPEFFQTKLVINGVPLIYFKGDLALTFMAVSAVFIAAIARPAQRPWLWPLAYLELTYVIGGANRASMLGALVALAWLALSRLRRLVLVQTAVLAAAVLAVCALAFLADSPSAQRKLDGAVERLMSLGDIVGRGNYVSEESAMKGDNNRFRTMWWRTVVTETLAQNPAFGLGFGYDLARGFLQEFNPDMAEEFTARSPHSIVVSAFGRMGFAGLAVFAGLFGLLLLRTWRVMRDDDSEPLIIGLWAAVWVILISSCLGVVLEGPMGAVVFWTLLGLANTTSFLPTETVTEATADAPLATEQETASR